MAKLTPVKGNPFAPNLTPVKGNPFGEDLKAQAKESTMPEISPFPEDRRDTRAVQELPEMLDGVGILSGEDTVRAAAVVPALTTAVDPQEIASILSSNFPNIGISQDSGGNLMATNNATGVQVMLNKPGLSKVDLAQAFGIGSLFLPGTSGIQGVGRGALTQLAARSAGTQTGIEALQASSGGTFDPEEIVVATAAAPVGQVAGEILSGLARGTGSVIKGAFRKGRDGIKALKASVEDLSDDGAATLLADAMVREGMTPEQFARQLQELGPDAVPADTGESFSRLLRLASNKIPRIEGRGRQILDARQTGQASRISSAFEDASGTPLLSVDDEIARLNKAYGPQIEALYKEAKFSPLRLSKRLRTLLTGDNDLAKAYTKAQKRVANKRAVGDEITQIDIIDATKQELDDQIGAAIRKGKKNTARDLIRLKNSMIEEVDIAVPSYAEARSLFAGKANLENAAESGSLFLKMKSREVADMVKTMSDSEKRMYVLGAKQAIIDKLESTPLTHDSVKRLFSKGGDASKLRSLFGDDEAYGRFSDAMRREANFVMTRRAAQGNSSTARQLFDSDQSSMALNSARTALGDPVAGIDMLNSITSGLTRKKNSQAYIRSLEKVGDILLESGMNPQNIVGILRRGAPKEITKAVERRLFRNISAPAASTLSTQNQTNKGEQ